MALPAEPAPGSDPGLLTTGGGPLAPEEVLAIQRVLARYGHLADNGDHAGLTAVFTPDVVFETATGLRLEGLSALIEAMSGGGMPDHGTFNTVVERDADGEVQSWSRYLAVDDAGTVASGEYLDRFVATPDGWRIVHRRATRRRPAPPSGRPSRAWYAPWRGDVASDVDIAPPAPTEDGSPDPAPDRAAAAQGRGTAWLFIGDERTDAVALAASLGAELVAAPTVAVDEPLAWPWRDELAVAGTALAEGTRHPAVVVCTWEPSLATGPLVQLALDGWTAAVEAPLARWFTVVRAAARRCEDGGSLVVVVERPAALDSVGHATTTAVAEGLIALARSASMTHGDRGVRVNVITTAVSTAPDVLLGSKPPLGSFPGTVAEEIAGAVRMLSSPDASGVSGTVVRADCGRSWT